MLHLRACNILTPLGIAVLLALVLQVVVVEAEHFGLFDCESVSAFMTPGGGDAKNIPAKSCDAWCCGHLLGVVVNSSQCTSFLHHVRISFALIDDIAPDGPVKVIDLPPQLS